MVHRSRGDVVRGGQVTLLAHRDEPTSLSEKLLATLRTEFSGDVIVFDPRDPVFGGPACAVSGCIRVAHGQGLCSGHHLRWRNEGRPALGAFVATTDPRCFGGRAVGDAVPVFERQVTLPALPPGLRLEVQYLLQCRRDDRLARCSVPTATRMVRVLAGIPVTSLLDWDESRWRRSFGRPAPKDAGARALIIYGLGKLDELAFGPGWESEYPRDVWRLHHLGYPTGDGSPARLHFDRIAQPWLRELAKRWLRWRLSAGLGATAAARCVGALTRFARFLERAPLRLQRLADVDRSVLEQYLADLAAELAGRPAHRSHIGLLSQFFQAVRHHGWDLSLPGTATFYPEDYPKGTEQLPRALPEHVIAQVERPSNLERFNNPSYELTTRILIRCGLRVSDALKLAFDCIIEDGDGAPYLRYENHKMRREALVPIDEELRGLIGEQQRRVLARFPEGALVLFPRPLTNPDGHKPIGSSVYRGALYRWLRQCDVRDERGQPVHLTPHQWRHSLGTTLINLDVPQEVVRKLLDHDSHQMVAHYARLSDTTIRRHWERARKVNVSGEVVTLDPAGPLAEASWAKQRLARATQALPNGYCGLPLVKTCPHANACLSCPMFITTAEFLPLHRQHHEQVVEIITAAEAKGQTRMVEMNRQVAENLEKIITALAEDEESSGGSADAS